MKKLAPALMAVGVLAVGGTMAACTGGETGPGHETTSEHADTAKKKDAEPSGPATSMGDGTYLVGSDVKAGTYKTDGEGSDMDMGCYWEKAKDDSGSMDAIISNNYAQGPGRVSIETGQTFKVSGGCEWKLVVG